MLIRSIGHHLLTGQDFALFGEAVFVYPACLWPSIEIHHLRLAVFPGQNSAARPYECCYSYLEQIFYS